jgi:hypothetical protein
MHSTQAVESNTGVTIEKEPSFQIAGGGASSFWPENTAGTRNGGGSAICP